MLDINLSSPVEIRNAGMKVLQDALSSVDMVKFMQQYDMGYGMIQDKNFGALNWRKTPKNSKFIKFL